MPNSDTLILVAPRPVRLAPPAPFSSFAPTFLHRPQPAKAAAAIRYVATPTDSFDRLKLSDNEDDLSVPSPERDRPISPRTSPLYVSLPHYLCLMSR